jgi:SAM-dependent methyltransferase
MIKNLERERADFNFRSIQPYLPRNARALEIEAQSNELGKILKERAGCDATPLPHFDGGTLPFESKSFDVVLLLYVLHLTADDGRLLEEARRVCKDGGCVIVAEDSVDGFWNRLTTAGFHLRSQSQAGIKRDGRFRTMAGWRSCFQKAGLTVDWTICLGRHLGRRLWPNNLLFVLSKSHVPVPV